jgi:hypothetical protein
MSLAHIPWLSKRDAMDSRDVILEMVDVVKNQALRLTHRMVTGDRLICSLVFQVNVFHMVHHVGDALKAATALLILIPFISNANDTLRLLADEGELLHGHRGGLRTWTFFLHRSFVGWRGPWLLSLLPRSKRDHEVDSTDLAADDVLHTQVHREVAEDPL